MREDVGGRRQRAVMATDAEWERIGRAAAESGMDLSRFVIHRALDLAPLPPEVLRWAVREMLVLSILEEKRLREAGASCRSRPTWWSWWNGTLRKRTPVLRWRSLRKSSGSNWRQCGRFGR